MRYIWQIKTADKTYAGTDARVFLGLAGLDEVMKEVPITDEAAQNDWEQNEINTGMIETVDLGELQTATLRHDNSGPGSSWWVDWLKVTAEDDGREWTAQIGREDVNGRYPLLRMVRTSDGQYAMILEQKRRADLARRAKSEREKWERYQREEDERAQRELEERDAQLRRDMEKAQQDAEIRRRQADMDRLKNGNTGGSNPVPPGGSGGGGGGGGGSGTLRTYELFGVLNGANVPLSQVAVLDRATGRYSVVSGGRAMVGEVPSDGFGLAGVPGKWSAWYPGQSPASFGLDADKAVLGWDGSRGWVLNAAFLTQILGGGWRAAVYS